MSEKHSVEDVRQLLLEQLRQKKLVGEPLAQRLLTPLPRHERGQIVPLSFGQQQLWFLSRLAKEPVYNECATVHLPGSLDRKVFERSFNEFIRRHEIWRTSFPEKNGQPFQKIHPFEPLELPFVDLRHLPPEEREKEAQRLAAEQARLPFDLANGPLLRCLLIQVDDQFHHLYLTLHHIIFDGVTLYQVFLPELWTLYEAFCADRSSPLPEPAYQYADYALWQQTSVNQSLLDRQLAYWREALAGAPALINLPTDFSRPPVQSFRGGMVPFALSRELTEAIKRLAREEGMTLYMVLMASLQLLLYRYTQQEEIVVGAVLGSREQRPEFARMPGYFLNTLPLSCKLTGSSSFRSLLQQVRERVIGAIAHQDIPFSYLVEQLQVERSASWNPLFQVALTLVPQLPALPSGWTITQMDVSAGASKFDLSLEVDDRPDGRLIGRFEYSSDLFEEQTIVRLARHWQTLLSSLVSDPSCSLSSLPLLSPEERHQLLVSFSSSSQTLPPSPVPAIHLLFEAQVQRSPSSCALLELPSGSSLSYHSLNSQANQLARLLLSLGLSPSSPVALLLPPSPSFFIALLAVLKAGSFYLPLDPATPPSRLSSLLSHVQPSFLLSCQALSPSLPSLPAHTSLLLLDSPDTLSRLSSFSLENLPFSGSPDQLAYLIFTSGSTGTPKAVSISHANLLSSTLSRLLFYHHLPPSRFLLLSPCSFDSSVAGIFWSLCSGSTLVLPPFPLSDHLSLLPSLLQQAHISHLLAVPSLYRFLLQHSSPSQLSSLRCCIVAGEPCPRSLVQLHYALLPQTPLFNEYGPSEATVWASVHLCSPSDPFPTAPIGHPLPHCSLYVLDPSLQPVPIGVPGELFIGGPSLSPGYFRQPSLSAQHFLPNPFSSDPSSRLYRTGDLVRWLPNGSLLFLGRLDQQVKLRGFRIELGEIEALLCSHPSVQEAAVLLQQPSPDDPSSARLLAFVSPRPGTQLTPSALRSFASEQLPAYMVPTSFVVLDALPHTISGKVDRRALASLPAPEHEIVQGAKVAPRTLLEQQLAQLWEELLNVQPIGVCDNFFEIGGHSLLAARLFARIEQQFGKQLPLSLLFQEPTIERLAKAIEEGESQKHSEAPVIAVQRQGKKRPLFYLHGDWTGGAFYCIKLAKQLGEDQPFYAVEPYRFPQKALPPSFEEMAAAHIEAIRQIQPHGPYRLAGWCNGGLVAYEMARQLQAVGEKVELLVLIDPTAPERGWSQARLACSFIRALGALLHWNELQQLECYRRWRYRYSLWRYRLVRRRKGSGENEPAPPNEDHQRWTSTCSWILTRYRSGPYRGDITFFWAAEEKRWRRKPWLDFARHHQQEGRGHIDSQELPGTHITSRTTYLTVFAAALKRRLEAIEENDIHQIDGNAKGDGKIEVIRIASSS